MIMCVNIMTGDRKKEGRMNACNLFPIYKIGLMQHNYNIVLITFIFLIICLLIIFSGSLSYARWLSFRPLFCLTLARGSTHVHSKYQWVITHSTRYTYNLIGNNVKITPSNVFIFTVIQPPDTLALFFSGKKDLVKPCYMTVI